MNSSDGISLTNSDSASSNPGGLMAAAAGAVACPDCSQMVPYVLLVDHIRAHRDQHWRGQIESLQAQLKEARQGRMTTDQNQSQSTLNTEVSVEEKVQEEEQDQAAVMMETEQHEEDEDEEEEEEMEDEEMLMTVDELQADLDSHDPTDVDGWMNTYHALIVCEEVTDLRAENNHTEQLKLLIKNATSTSRPPPSHTAMIPLEVRFENVGEDIEEARELAYNPDSRETALDHVLHQLDHLPESMRTLLEQMVANHNADDHPLKYCSVEEFHSMVDSHLHPSGGGEFEYVGKLVQQLESALKLSQYELAKYMKTKELDFNEMGPLMIEQKRIKEELSKQRAILFPLESPLWQACINYLKDVERSFDHDPRTHRSLFPQGSTPTTAASSNVISTSINRGLPIAPTPASSSKPPISLDAAAMMEEDTSGAIVSEVVDAADSSIMHAEVSESDEEELMDELLEEVAEDRSGRYQWMMSQIDQYSSAQILGYALRGPVYRDLHWSDVQAYLSHTSFIGEEVKGTIQFLFTQPNFTIQSEQTVRSWSGWNSINLKSDEYTPLDSSIPVNRKLLRGLDALMDVVIELTDEFLEEDEFHSRSPFDLLDRLSRELESLASSYKTPAGQTFREQLDEIYQELDEIDQELGEETCWITPDEHHSRQQQLTELTHTFIEAQLSESTEEERMILHERLDTLATTLEQQQMETIIPRRNMELLIREIVQEYETKPRPDGESEIDFTPEAIEAIQVAAEDYLIKQFDAAGAELSSMNHLSDTCGGCHASFDATKRRWKCQDCPIDFHYCGLCHTTNQHTTPHPPSHTFIRLAGPIHPSSVLTTLNRRDRRARPNLNYRWSQLHQLGSIHHQDST